MSNPPDFPEEITKTAEKWVRQLSEKACDVCDSRDGKVKIEWHEAHLHLFCSCSLESVDVVATKYGDPRLLRTDEKTRDEVVDIISGGESVTVNHEGKPYKVAWNPDAYLPTFQHREVVKRFKVKTEYWAQTYYWEGDRFVEEKEIETETFMGAFTRKIPSE